MMHAKDLEELHQKVKSLNELLWEHRVNLPVIEQWLDNFVGAFNLPQLERDHALYLLSKFLYFGRKEIRQLLGVMFRDLIRQPLTILSRDRLHGSNDFAAVHREYEVEIGRTRFLGLGNPAESGTHILYHFRQVNQIPSCYFPNFHDLFTGQLHDPQTAWQDGNIRRLILIDDFCGTGVQAEGIGKKIVPLLQDVSTRGGVTIEVWYLTLFATSTGLERLRLAGLFDHVESVSELDPSYRVFDDKSQFYIQPPSGINKSEAEGIVRGYGEKLWPGAPLGFGDCQLLIGFHHNVPDNTLPIITQERSELPWRPVFPRDDKF